MTGPGQDRTGHRISYQERNVACFYFILSYHAFSEQLKLISFSRMSPDSFIVWEKCPSRRPRGWAWVWIRCVIFGIKWQMKRNGNRVASVLNIGFIMNIICGWNGNGIAVSMAQPTSDEGLILSGQQHHSKAVVQQWWWLLWPDEMAG